MSLHDRCAGRMRNSMLAVVQIVTPDRSNGIPGTPRCVRAVAMVIVMVFIIGGSIGRGAALELDFTVATTHPPSLPWVTVIRDHVIPEFNRRLKLQRPDIEVRWTPAWGTLYKWQDSLQAVGIGLADIGWVGSLWESSRLPLQNVTYALPFITDDLVALMDVFNDMHDQLPALRQSWERYGVHFLGVSGVDTYHLLTRFPVESLDDLRGRKILAPGASAVWLKGTGAIAVDGALTSYYTQLKTGVADGVITILSGALPFRIHEVAPFITLVGIGAQCTGALTVNLDVWRRLPEQAQTILRDLGHQYSARAAEAVVTRYDQAIITLVAEGAHLSTLSATDKQRWINGLPNLARDWVARVEGRKLPATQVLRALMGGLRQRGVVPVRDWERDLDHSLSQ